MTYKLHLTHDDVEEYLNRLYKQLSISYSRGDDLCVYPVPRGGVPVAYALQRINEQLKYIGNITLANEPEQADVIIDDLLDSGSTAEQYKRDYPHLPFFVLLNKKELADNPWVVFPWEVGEEDGADDIPVRLLEFIGEDPKRGGLKETPKRFLKAWEFLTSGYDKKPEDFLKVFKDGAEDCDEMVLVKSIPVYSQCEHHLLPFFGVAHVAYIPDGKIVGLSKLNRIVDMYSRRLQVQERLTNQIATALVKHLKPLGVAVVIQARHMCMESRGVCQQGHSTTTSSMHGVFKEQVSTRMEFLDLIK